MNARTLWGEAYITSIVHHSHEYHYHHIGRRIDQVEYHPDYQHLMTHALRAGCAAYGYNHGDLHSSHVARGMYVLRFTYSYI